MFKTLRHLTLSLSRRIKFKSSRSNSLRLILILYSHIGIRLPSSLLLSYFKNKFCIYLLSERFGGETEMNETIARPRSRWEGIKVDVKKMGWEDVEWIHLAQDMKGVRLLWTRWRKFGLRTTRETGWIGEKRVACQAIFLLVKTFLILSILLLNNIR